MSGEWRAVVDARVIDAMEEHTRVADRLRREPSLPTWARNPKLHLDPSAWRAGYLGVRGDYDIPHALTMDLQERMPQALLRDLYRPVRESRWIEREIVEGTSRDCSQALTEARAARRPQPLPRIEPATRTVRAYQIWRRGMYDERWQPVIADDDPRRKRVSE